MKKRKRKGANEKGSLSESGEKNSDEEGRNSGARQGFSVKDVWKALIAHRYWEGEKTNGYWNGPKGKGQKRRFRMQHFARLRIAT